MEERKTPIARLGPEVEELIRTCGKERRFSATFLYKGLRIAVEGSYEPREAEQNARARLAGYDLVVALWCNPSEDRKYVLRFFVPGEEITEALPSKEKGRISGAPAQGWIETDPLTLEKHIGRAVRYITLEGGVRKAEGEIKSFVDEFCQSLESIDKDLRVYEALYESFSKLYNFSLGKAEEIRDLIYSKAALALLLGAVLHESTRAKDAPPLSAIAEGGLQSLKGVFNASPNPLLKVAGEILEKLPPEVQPQIADLVRLAERIAGNKALLRRDFAGRIYHCLVGDWAVRKGFATYFTAVPAAYLLARLALLTPNPSWESFASPEDVGRFRVADLTCGSGTLLSAAYDSLLYLYLRDCPNPDIDGFHRAALEKVLWGFDALRFATYIAAVALTLHNPRALPANTNVHAVPLGVSQDGKVSLGSLDFEAGISGAAVACPESFNLVIMNPPFTRATGRGGRDGGGLFGFVRDEEDRKLLLKAYSGLRKEITRKMAEEAGLPPMAQGPAEGFLEELRAIVEGRSGLKARDVRPFYEAGQAGEALPFIYIAGKRVPEGGRIALVLPRALLSGISWFVARAFLASNFHLEYIVVSYDPKGGYNFSESTALSECLIVARRVLEHNKKERTNVVILLEKPRSALEGILLAHEVIKRSRKGFGCLRAGRSRGVVYSVSRELLLKHLDNWGKLAAFTNPELSLYAIRLLEGRIDIGRGKVRVPVRRLGEMASLGIDRHQFGDGFRIAEGGPNALPAVYGGKEDVRGRLKAEPNTHVIPLSEGAKRTFERSASELLVPDRINFTTAHTTSIYVTEPVLSNVFYAVKLEANTYDRLKALCAWLNSTWGIMTILACRQETEGAWIRLKMSHWRLLPVLDVIALSDKKIKALSEVFERFSDANLKRLPEQYSQVQEERLGLDLGVLKALEPTIKEEEVKNHLRKLYQVLDRAFQEWIGGHGPAKA